VLALVLLIESVLPRRSARPRPKAPRARRFAARILRRLPRLRARASGARPPPPLQLDGIEAHVAAESDMRDAIGAGFGQNPRLRNTEEVGRSGCVDKGSAQRTRSGRAMTRMPLAR
jgi:hypothetical protein